MAIARRMGAGKKIIAADRSLDNARKGCSIMNQAGFDCEPVEMDLASRKSIVNMLEKAQSFGEISMVVNAAGVSPSQASIETILRTDLYGTAVLLEEAGKVIRPGGAGLTISSQSGWRMPALSAAQDAELALTDCEQLLDLPLLQPENIRDNLHAYQLTKRCNEKRVMAQAIAWSK